MRNSQKQLVGLFNDHEGPDIITFESSPVRAYLTLHIPKNLTWFEGHFPEQKVLPGVVQIDWCGKLAQTLFADLGSFKQLTNIKFKSMVIPDTYMSLELTYDTEKGNVKFHFFNQTESFSMGTFKFLTL